MVRDRDMVRWGRVEFNGRHSNRLLVYTGHSGLRSLRMRLRRAFQMLGRGSAPPQTPPRLVNQLVQAYQAPAVLYAGEGL